MISIENKSKCSGCYACAAICPKNCISMESDNEGFWYPRVDAEKCINCNLCEKICPILDEKKLEDNDYPKAYAVINTDKEIRYKSSSGGVFSLLAEHIISKGGVVFGASFSKDFRSVQHIDVTNINELCSLRGSKYLQSKIGNTYQKAKDYLEQGRFVLFSGTPCQVAGLKAYLRKDYKNLYVQDIVCHGVPSPLVWKKYIDFRERKAGSHIKGVSFRCKEQSWKNYSVKFEFANSTEYVKTYYDDIYMKGFLKDLYLRPSCYSCFFKGIKRDSDITLADFWGVQEVLPEMDDDNGTSLILVNSYKGKLLIDSVLDKSCYKETNISESLKHNPSVDNSAKYNDKRESFFMNFQKKSIDKLTIKLTNRPLHKRIISNIHRLVNKLRKIFSK